MKRIMSLIAVFIMLCCTLSAYADGFVIYADSLDAFVETYNEVNADLGVSKLWVEDESQWEYEDFGAYSYYEATYYLTETLKLHIQMDNDKQVYGFVITYERNDKEAFLLLCKALFNAFFGVDEAPRYYSDLLKAMEGQNNEFFVREWSGGGHYVAYSEMITGE